MISYAPFEIYIDKLLFCTVPRNKVYLIYKVEYITTVKGNNLFEQISFNKFSAAVHEGLNEVSWAFFIY